MPPPSYFCKLCSKDVEEAGIRSEHTALRAVWQPFLFLVVVGGATLEPDQYVINM